MPAEGGLMMNWNVIGIVVTIIIGVVGLIITVVGLIITVYFGLKPLKKLENQVTKIDLIAAIHAFGRANKENRIPDLNDFGQGYALAENLFGYNNIKDGKIPTTRKRVLATILDGGGNYPIVEEEETIQK